MSEDEIAAIDRRAGALFSELNVDPRPLPGAQALLTALLESALPFVIATSSLGAQVTASLEALDLPGRPIIVDGEHVEHAKPAPDLLLLAAETGGCRRSGLLVRRRRRLGHPGRDRGRHGRHRATDGCRQLRTVDDRRGRCRH